MSFKVMYYITIACPTIEKSLEMVDKYAAHGAASLQLDMPSADPYGETDFVKRMMLDALESCSDYRVYMGAFRSIHARHPAMELNIVVYPDVVEAIGLENFCAFAKEIDAASVRIAGTDPCADYISYLNENGVKTFDAISYHWTEEAVERIKKSGNPVMMRARRKTEMVNPACDSWKDRVDLLRSKGMTSFLFAVADISTGAEVLERKRGGTDGAIIGNSLMRLWGDEDKLFALMREFEDAAKG